MFFFSLFEKPNGLSCFLNHYLGRASYSVGFWASLVSKHRGKNGIKALVKMAMNKRVLQKPLSSFFFFLNIYKFPLMLLRVFSLYQTDINLFLYFSDLKSKRNPESNPSFQRNPGESNRSSEKRHIPTTWKPLCLRQRFWSPVAIIIGNDVWDMWENPVQGYTCRPQGSRKSEQPCQRSCNLTGLGPLKFIYFRFGLCGGENRRTTILLLANQFLLERWISIKFESRHQSSGFFGTNNHRGYFVSLK